MIFIEKSSIEQLISNYLNRLIRAAKTVDVKLIRVNHLKNLQKLKILKMSFVR